MRASEPQVVIAGPLALRRRATQRAAGGEDDVVKQGADDGFLSAADSGTPGGTDDEGIVGDQAVGQAAGDVDPAAAADRDVVVDLVPAVGLLLGFFVGEQDAVAGRSGLAPIGKEVRVVLVVAGIEQVVPDGRVGGVVKVDVDAVVVVNDVALDQGAVVAADVDAFAPVLVDLVVAVDRPDAEETGDALSPSGALDLIAVVAAGVMDGVAFKKQVLGR